MTATHEVSITRTFDAPRKLVFNAFTDPDQVQQWWSPTHWDNAYANVEARAGGEIKLGMRDPEGTIYPMNGTFEEVDEPNRLVFVTRALPQDDGSHHLEVRNTINFIDKGDKTELRFHAVALTVVPGPAEYAVQGMEMGWIQSFEKLTTLLAS